MNYPMHDGTAKLLTTEEYFQNYPDLCSYQPFLDTVRNHGINSCKADVFSDFISGTLLIPEKKESVREGILPVLLSFQRPFGTN